MGCPLDPAQVVGESRRMDKLSSLLVKGSHHLHVTISALGSSFSDRLIHPKCVKERYHRSVLPAAFFCTNWTIFYTHIYYLLTTAHCHTAYNSTVHSVKHVYKMYESYFYFLTFLLYFVFVITVLWL